MISPMFGHRPKHKKFHYEFRYYDPKEDERKKRRIKIKRPQRKTNQTRSVVMLALGLAFVVWLITVL